MPHPINSMDQDQSQDTQRQTTLNNFDKQKDTYQKLTGQLICSTSSLSTNSNSPNEKDRVFGNKKAAHTLMIGDAKNKIDKLQSQYFFNFAQQELSLYQKSMQQSQTP